MFNPDAVGASPFMPSLETAARSLKVVPIIAPVHSDVEIETAIIALGREPGGGLVVIPGALTFAHRAPIILAAARNNVPAVYGQSVFPRDGGLPLLMRSNAESRIRRLYGQTSWRSRADDEYMALPTPTASLKDGDCQGRPGDRRG